MVTTSGPLGLRHFVVDPSQSALQVKLPGGLTVEVGKFQGQSNGQTEAAFLDLEAGELDEHGFTNISIPRASQYIYVDATTLAGFVICIKPLVPVVNAGALGCNGGMDVSIFLNQDHRLGRIGVNGVTAAQCAAAQGHVEVPYNACTAGNVDHLCAVDVDCDTSMGANDGTCTHFPAVCTAGKVGMACEASTDCATDVNPGQCGMPHGGVCNGPLVPGTGTGDSGCGEMLIVPNPNVQLNGLPIELSFEAALPCGDEGPGRPSPFALTTGMSRSLVTHANSKEGTLTFQVQGQNFSCQNWQAGGMGRLVLSAPAIDQQVQPGVFQDVATIFNLVSE